MILLAGQAQVGKTTAANIIAKEVFDLGLIPVILSFASPLKEMALAAGFDKKENLDGYRQYCQEHGAGARKEDPDHWVNLFDDAIKMNKELEQHAKAEGKTHWERVIICDDCRHPNEVRYGLENNARLVFVSYGKRDKFDPEGDWRTHESEELANNMEDGANRLEVLFHTIIKNEGTIKDFEEKLKFHIPEWCGIKSAAEHNADELQQKLEELIALLLKLSGNSDDQPTDDSLS